MAMAVFLWDSFEMSKSINSGCYLSDVLKPPVFKSSVTVAKGEVVLNSESHNVNIVIWVI